MEHSLEVLSDIHAPILAAAALEGVDVSATLGAVERYVCYGRTKYGYGPIGIMDIVGTQYVAEPHMTWFTWTSDVSRVTGFKRAMEYLAKTREVFLTVEKKEAAFFDRFVKRGLLRKVGFLEDMPIVEEIHMYQYRRKKVQ